MFSKEGSWAKRLTPLWLLVGRLPCRSECTLLPHLLLAWDWPPHNQTTNQPFNQSCKNAFLIIQRVKSNIIFSFFQCGGCKCNTLCLLHVVQNHHGDRLFKAFLYSPFPNYPRSPHPKILKSYQITQDRPQINQITMVSTFSKLSNTLHFPFLQATNISSTNW